jgi:hypothetical protein
MHVRISASLHHCIVIIVIIISSSIILFFLHIGIMTHVFLIVGIGSATLLVW